MAHIDLLYLLYFFSNNEYVWEMHYRRKGVAPFPLHYLQHCASTTRLLSTLERQNRNGLELLRQEGENKICLVGVLAVAITEKANSLFRPGIRC